MKMKSTAWIWGVLIGLYLAFSAFFVPQKEVAPDISGTWILKASKKGDAAQFTDQPKGIKKKKIIVGNHFSWYEYDTNGKLIALGGGTYKLDGNTYTEKIEYFYPAGSSLLGTSIPFTCTMETKNKWIHSGYIQEKEIDSTTGQYVVTNNEKLEEVWEKEL